MKEKQVMVLYEIIQQKLCESKKCEITTREFKDIIQRIRISPKLWFVIMNEMRMLKLIRYDSGKNMIYVNGVNSE